MCGASPLTTLITSSGPLIHRPYRSDDDLGPTELAYLEPLAPYDRSDGGYSEIMLTRPDTIAAALIDSPVGLAAWIIHKFHDWRWLLRGADAESTPFGIELGL